MLSAFEDSVVHDLLFLRVPDPTRGKNRLHLDFRPKDQEREVQRLITLGARPARVGQCLNVSWVVLAGPEGNESCVLRPLHAPSDRDTQAHPGTSHIGSDV